MGAKEFIITLLAGYVILTCYAAYASIQWKKHETVASVFLMLLEKNGVDLYSRETTEQIRDIYMNRKM